MEIKTENADPSKLIIAGFNKNAAKTLVKPTAIITESNNSRADIDLLWVKLLITPKKING